MRIRRLDLLAYGPFTDQSLDFGEGPGGFALVYGPNEAGKSALRRAINAWLFGIPTRTTDDFVHTYKQLRLAGRLENDLGEALEFLRLKSRKKSIRNPAQGDAILAENALTPYLRGIDEAAFMQLYSLGQAGLREGGQELRRLQGLAGESLFAAGLGIRGLSRLLGTLKSEADEVYTKGVRSKTLIPTAIRAYKNATEERKKAECSPAHWSKVNRELEKARRKHADVVEQHKQEVAEQARLERIGRIHAELGRRRLLTEKIEALSEVAPLPAGYDPERRRKAQETLRQVDLQEQRLAQQLEGETGLQGRLQALAVPRKLLGQGQAITRLHKELGAYEGFCTDRPKREDRRETLDAAIARVVADLGLPPSRDSWFAALAGSELTAELQELIQSRRGLESAELTLIEQLDDIDRELQELRSERPSDQAEDTSLAALQAAVRAASQQGDLSQQRLSAEQALNAAESDFLAASATVREVSGTASEIERLSVPARTVVDRMRIEAAELAHQELDLQERTRSCVDAQERLGREREELRKHGPVATQQALVDARARRQTGWSLVRGAWLDGTEDARALGDFAQDQELPLAYEQSVRRADELADELRLRADEVARLEHSDARLMECQDLATKLSQEFAELELRGSSFELAWTQLWAELAIDQPGRPVEMLEWLEAFELLRHKATGCRKAAELLAATDQRLGQHRRVLGRELESLGEAPLDPDRPFESLVEHCSQRVASRTKASDLREHARQQADTLRGKRESYAARLARAKQVLQAWQERWTAATAVLGLVQTVSPAAVSARLDGLRSLAEHLEQRDELDDRIDKMRSQQEGFEASVHELAAEVAPDLRDWPAGDIVGELQGRHVRAKADLAKYDTLQEQISRYRDQRAEGAAQAKAATQDLAQLCSVLGVHEPGALAGAEGEAKDKTDLEVQLLALDDRLLAHGGGASVPELLLEAEGKQAETIAAELEVVAEAIAKLESYRDELSGTERERLREVEAVSGAGAAADADERALALLGRIRGHAEDYLRLRLAEAVLRQRIEAHQGEHEDPVLAGASRLFRQFTCEDFSGLALGVDNSGRDVIQGVRAESGELLDLEAFSQGTADQLYLALRLAYLEHAADDAERMPLIVDDILVDFDDARALATLRGLAELAGRRQVLLFTHHEHVRALAREAVGDLRELQL